MLEVEYILRLELLKNIKRFWFHCRRMNTGVRIVGFLLYDWQLTLAFYLGAQLYYLRNRIASDYEMNY